MNKKELAESIKQAVGTMKNCDGCYEIPLEGNLSLFVGWSDGYEEDGHTIVKDGYGLCMAIKVNTSDDLKTDFDYINFPYYDTGDCWDTTLSAEDREDYESTASWFLGNLEEMLKCEMDDHGRILNYASPDDFCEKNEIK